MAALANFGVAQVRRNMVVCVILKYATWSVSQLQHARVCEWLTVHCGYLAGDFQKYEGSGPNFRRKTIFCC